MASKNDSAFKKYAEGIAVITSQLMGMKFYLAGQRDGIIRPDIEPEFYVYLMEHLIEMINDEKLKAIIPDIHKRYDELMKFYFYGMRAAGQKPVNM